MNRFLRGIADQPRDAARSFSLRSGGGAMAAQECDQHHRGRNQCGRRRCAAEPLQSLGWTTTLVAAIAIAGSCLDVLGSLYLAYDLLGGPHGPLRLLTRAVTYSILFGLGYGLGLGLIFGVASGLAIGVTIAIELNRTSKRQDHYSLPWEALFSAIRACGLQRGALPSGGPCVSRFSMPFC